ncbi:hypothetical protein [Bacillus pseudomycoides]|uniref:hypothetical protein n=1 Tax=Bacillus pseudomycoides TaxID=64104 RepID=UPI000BEC89A3|nr:hypothetical protein [Bacillus pseudomycoides]PED05106.1 hypothetical protein COO19_28390 [Bacillus pseudomycoides]PEI85516.1 hypothetical protein CN686_28135 [Bacillus pseudomycoides]PEK10660.1 hypothetical protein CN693_27035 [Bacillus pseudomycoides]PEM70778.1 hypothetical protein CN619_19500 [Bacillus pseudomycoides]PEO10151.1 hypothetical protein CN542_22910 [Bacillus pseudomycoides]
MKINLIIFISSVKEQKEKNIQELMLKTFESTIRPNVGDLLSDPGFDSEFHNGYEVVKVDINYELNECFVSLAPLALEIEKIEIETYIQKLKTYGWRIVSKKEVQSGI